MSANAVHFPTELVERVDECMAAKGGYSNRAEFIREAVRKVCDQIEREQLLREEISNGSKENKNKKRGFLPNWENRE